jgi:hypothetical protein
MKSLSTKKNMNHEKHVTQEEIYTSANILLKYLKGKIKASTPVVSA